MSNGNQRGSSLANGQFKLLQTETNDVKDRKTQSKTLQGQRGTFAKSSVDH